MPPPPYETQPLPAKMPTQTVRRMEEDGLVRRTIHPVIPPRVDHALTPLGESLTAAFCGVWLWAEKHHDAVQEARLVFAASRPAQPGGPTPWPDGSSGKAGIPAARTSGDRKPTAEPKRRQPLRRHRAAITASHHACIRRG